MNDWMPVKDWMLEAASKTTADRVSDLDGDCTAHWAGLILRAEGTDVNEWWWCVYEERREYKMDTSNNHEVTIPAGDAARNAAEQAARLILRVNRAPPRKTAVENFLTNHPGQVRDATTNSQASGNKT